MNPPGTVARIAPGADLAALTEALQRCHSHLGVTVIGRHAFIVRRRRRRLAWWQRCLRYWRAVPSWD